MRFLLLALLSVTVASCDFFSDPDNRPPRISYGEFYVSDVADAFEVTMRTGAADLDGNLDGLECTGDISYSGPSPLDTTAFFPLEETGEQIHSECVASDTEGLVSDALVMYLTLPDSVVLESDAP